MALVVPVRMDDSIAVYAIHSGKVETEVVVSGGGAGSLHRSNRMGRMLDRAQAHIARSAANAKAMAGRAHAAGMRGVERLQKKPPLCFRIVYQIYHKYGMKHLILILTFLFYTAFGAGIFYMLEKPAQSEKENAWINKTESNRGRIVDNLMNSLFNNSEFLIYIKGPTADRVRAHINKAITEHEKTLGSRWSEQRMELNYWNALLFAGTLCTTIGYGYIYPMTDQGKIFTMVYALFGIPLMLLVLQDFGKLMTKMMKYPWFQAKRFGRRFKRCFTKLPTIREMREIEEQERRDLDIFDLPIVVGVSLIVIWVWACVFFLRYHGDSNWTLLETFYFFFISLSTIGLGDLVPHDPSLLLFMFLFILVGLSLVSMVINLLQSKMRKTFEAGRHDSCHGIDLDKGTSLGVLQCFEEDDDSECKKLSPIDVEAVIRKVDHSTQTSLSLPGVRQVVLRSDGVHWVEAHSPFRSPDEVTNLVELESGLAVCSDLGEFNRDGTDNEEDHETNENDRLLARAETMTSDEEGL